MVVNLFAPVLLGGMELKNRFVRSATFERTADEQGFVTETSLDLYKGLADGGTGLIITGCVTVSDSYGRVGPQQHSISDDKYIDDLRRMVATVHRGGARICIQLVHAGIGRHDDGESLVVSNIPAVKKLQRQMTEEDIEQVIGEFVAASVRAAEAGFDAVQFHGCHGYLLSQFMSPRFNLRTDKWGGSPENRRRFLTEIVRRTRHALGSEFPILMKLGVRDVSAKGLTLEEGLAAARELELAGLDAIEASIGMATPVDVSAILQRGEERAYFRDLAAAVKRVVHIPVIAQGGIRTLKTARDIVDSGDADLIAMSRPLIREPELINLWQQTYPVDASCISCNLCRRESDPGPLKCGQLSRVRK